MSGEMQIFWSSNVDADEVDDARFEGCAKSASSQSYMKEEKLVKFSRPTHANCV